MLTERERRRFVRWLLRKRLLDAADMLAWENSGFSVDASVRITLIDRNVPSYFQSLEHLLRYCARPPFALERLSDLVPPAATGGRRGDGRAAGGCCDPHEKPRSHDTSRRKRPNSWPAWAKSFHSSARGAAATSIGDETAGRSRRTSNRRFVAKKATMASPA
ncbi:MAG: hypothetical protein ACKOBP_07755 [Planctomycetia bacterium]